MADEEMTMAAYSRRKNVTRKTVSTWRDSGYVAIKANGKVDVAESDRRLSERPVEYRGGVTKGGAEGGNAVRCVTGNSDEVTPRELARRQGAVIRALCDDEFSRGALWMAHRAVCHVGAVGALAAVEAGGSCAVAYGVKKVLEVAFVELMVDALCENRLGPFAGGNEDDPPIWPEPSQCADVNWSKVSEEAGETFDLAVWEQQFARLQARA